MTCRSFWFPKQHLVCRNSRNCAAMLSRPSASGRLIPSIECRKVAGCIRLRNSVDDPELNQLLPSVHVIAAKHTWLSYRSGLTRFSIHLLLGPQSVDSKTSHLSRPRHPRHCPQYLRANDALRGLRVAADCRGRRRPFVKGSRSPLDRRST